MSLKDPKTVIYKLISVPYNFIVKGSRTLFMDPGKDLEQIEEAYLQHFKIKLVQNYRLPLKNDHTEPNTTPSFFDDKKEVYKSLLDSC